MMRSRTSRRALLKSAFGLTIMIGIAPIAAACGGAAPPAPAKPAEPAKPVESKPAAPAAQPAATTAAKPAEPAKPAGAQELRLHVRVGPEEDTLNEVLPAFTKEKNISVKIESFPTNDYFTKIQTLIAGDQVGDVLWTVNYVGTFRWAYSKILRPLDDLVKADNFDTGQYYKAAWDAGRFQDASYGMPFKIHPGPAALYYNADQAAKANVTFPEKQIKSWDELLTGLKALTSSAGGRVERYGIMQGMSTDSSQQTWQLVQMYVRSYGGEYYSEDGKKAQFTDPKVKDAVRFIHALMHQHKVAVPQQDWPARNEDIFIAERASTFQASSSTKSIPTRIKDKFVVKNVIMPPGPGGKLGTQTIVDHIVMSAKTKQPQPSWELIKLLCGKEVGIRLGEGAGGVASGTSGGRQDVVNDPRLMKNPLHPIFIDLLQQAEVIRLAHNFRELEVAQALHQLTAPLWLGERQPDDAFFTELNSAVQAVLDKAAP